MLGVKDPTKLIKLVQRNLMYDYATNDTKLQRARVNEMRMPYGEVSIYIPTTEIGKVGAWIYDQFKSADIQCRIEMQGEEPEIEL